MTDLIAEIQKAVERKSDLRLLDAVATGANTVTVGQSTVAVTLPAIIPVVAGQFCQVLEQGADRVIIGPVGGWTLLSGVTKSDATGWSVTVTNVWRNGPLLWFPEISIQRTGVDVSGTNQTVTTFTAPAAMLGGSTTRQGLVYATATVSGTRPLIGCYYDADSGQLSVRVPNTVTWATSGTDVFTGMVPIL